MRAARGGALEARERVVGVSASESARRGVHAKERTCARAFGAAVVAERERERKDARQRLLRQARHARQLCDRNREESRRIEKNKVKKE